MTEYSIQEQNALTLVERLFNSKLGESVRELQRVRDATDIVAGDTVVNVGKSVRAFQVNTEISDVTYDFMTGAAIFKPQRTGWGMYRDDEWQRGTGEATEKIVVTEEQITNFYGGVYRIPADVANKPL